jgi:hypothetical protein
VSREARCLERHGVSRGTVSREARCLERHGVSRGTVSRAIRRLVLRRRVRFHCESWARPSRPMARVDCSKTLTRARILASPRGSIEAAESSSPVCALDLPEFGRGSSEGRIELEASTATRRERRTVARAAARRESQPREGSTRAKSRAPSDRRCKGERADSAVARSLGWWQVESLKQARSGRGSFRSQPRPGAGTAHVGILEVIGCASSGETSKSRIR